MINVADELELEGELEGVAFAGWNLELLWAILIHESNIFQLDKRRMIRQQQNTVKRRIQQQLAEAQPAVLTLLKIR